MKRPPRRSKKIKRVYLPWKKVAILLSVITGVGIFMLFTHAVFMPLPEDKSPSVAVSGTEAPAAAETPKAAASETNAQKPAPSVSPSASPDRREPSASASSRTTAPEKTPVVTSGRTAPENVTQLPAIQPPAALPQMPGASPRPVPVSGSRDKPSAVPEKPSVTSGGAEKPDVPATPQQPAKPAVKPGSKGTLIFVIDDAGHNLRQLEPFLKLPFPISIAVLPGLEYSVQAAQKIREAGKEVLLHQPMQAVNLSVDPGPGAITPGMTADTIEKILEANVAQIGPIAGINNHEGSLITADPEAMGAVIEFCGRKRLYFLDSRTTAETVAAREAEKRGITIWERAVFLDNSQEKTSIMNAIYGGMDIASSKGAAVMIGHVWSSELAQILSDMYPELVEQGFSLSTIAQIAVRGEDYEGIGY